MMEVTAWNNGYHAVTGGGYGLEIKVADRDRYFDKEWKTVRIALAGIPDEIEIYVVESFFWEGDCPALTNQSIGLWLIENHYAPWPKRKPPRFRLEPDGDARFVLEKID